MFYGADPISDKFPHLSPYNYASNNPVTNVDLWGLQGLHYMEVLNNGAKRHVIEKNIIVLTQPQKAIPEGATPKQIARFNRQNARIASSNVAKVQSAREELNNYYNGSDGQAKNSSGEPVRYQFNVSGLEDFDKTGMTSKEIDAQYKTISKENGMSGTKTAYGNTIELIAPATVITNEGSGGSYGNTKSNVVRMNSNAPEGTLSHEVIHGLGLPDNGYLKGGILASPPESIKSSEVDQTIKYSYERKNN